MIYVIEKLSRKELEGIVQDLFYCLQADRLRDSVYGWKGATPGKPHFASDELGDPERPAWLSLIPLGYGPRGT